MAEYIDREAALKAIAEDKIEMTPELIAIGRAIGTYTAEQAFDGINQACDRHIESIKIIPAEDVQPVKHGRWSGYVCSNCGISKYNFISFNFNDQNGYARPFGTWNYCPGCGTRMDSNI